MVDDITLPVDPNGYGDYSISMHNLNLTIKFEFSMNNSIMVGEIEFDWCHEIRMFDYEDNFHAFPGHFDIIIFIGERISKGRKFKEFSFALSNSDKIFLVLADSCRFRIK